MGVAIVTGAARGIGAAIADSLHSDGHQLVLVDRCANDPGLDYPLGTEAELRAVAERCGDAAIVIGDIAQATTNHQAAAAAKARFGGLDIAVAAAGVLGATGPAWLIDDDGWRAMFATNVTGTMRLAQASIPVMLERRAPRAGRFVAVSSAAALKATPNLAAYAASKAAVLSFVRSLAADLAGTDITANTVQPGSTDTPLLKHSAAVYDLHDPVEFATNHLDQRLLDPSEIGSAVAWLCSSGASAVTGAAIPVDGGMSSK